MSLSRRFDEAFQFASDLHRTQTRKSSGTPYISHLMAVAAIALEYGATEDEAIAALLHDAVEDQGGPPVLAEIRTRFSDDVAEIVDGCTDTDQVHKPSWWPRKVRFIERLAGAPYSVRLVVAADKLHNVQSVLSDYRRHREDLWPRFTGGKGGTLWFYRAVDDTLRQAARADETDMIRLLDEIERNVGELEHLVAVEDDQG
jgi:(p)ppGpp synthase/HD superfamily hydrolase